MNSKLIVALDFPNPADALAFVEKLDPALCGIKVGSEVFSQLGPYFVESLVKKGFKVFLDLKFHDIPNTVAGACKACANLGVWMINVHAFGGLEMMQAAKAALEPFGPSRPLLVAVTLLTSMLDLALPALGINLSAEALVLKLAGLAQKANLDGIVSSALEVSQVKRTYGNTFITVTPGIRLPSDAKDDQERIVTPSQAVNLGSDYLVMGRSITRAANPESVLQSVLDLIA